MSIRQSKTLLACIPVALLALVLVAGFIARNLRTVPGDLGNAESHPSSEKLSEAQVKELDVFHEGHRDAVNQKLKDAADRDPTLRESLQSVNEQTIRSLEGFSDAEKDRLWKEIRAAQETLKAQRKPSK